MTTNNPYRAPVAGHSPHPDPRRPGNRTELAGRGARWVAAMLDSVLSIAIMFPIMYLGGVFDGFPHIHPMPYTTELGYAVTGFVIFFLLHGYFLAKDGQSLGKKALGIKIVRNDESRASLGRLFGFRYAPLSIVALIPVVGQLLSLVDVLFIFRGDRRCLHDLIADTIVVKS